MWTFLLEHVAQNARFVAICVDYNCKYLNYWLISDKMITTLAAAAAEMLLQLSIQRRVTAVAIARSSQLTA